MRALRILTSSIIAIILLSAQLVWAISKEMHDLVHMETRVNAIGQYLESKGESAVRHTQAIQLEHYEIPIEFMQKSIALRANAEYVHSLVIERDGKKFVRWVLNPEDTKWHLRVERFLKRVNVSTQKHKYFHGYMTASRSYIVVDPQTNAEFSMKMSTDHTGGHWADKKQTWVDAKQVRMITDYVNDQLRFQPKLDNIVLLDEAIAFGIKGIDQGMLVRSYEGLSNSGKRYVPGFSVVNSEFGAKLALENGSKNPAEFWNDHYNKPLARALAEFMVLTGMSYDSPHSQNFLVELDAKNRPTGKIVLRDFGDTYLAQEYFDVMKKSHIPKSWEEGNVVKGRLHMSVGILHGNLPPKWLQRESKPTDSSSYVRWGLDFYDAFEKEFLRQSGFELSKGDIIRSVIVVDKEKKITRPGDYFSRDYSLTDSKGQAFLAAVAKGQQRDALLVRSCGRALFAN